MSKTTFREKCSRFNILKPEQWLCKQYQKGLSTKEISEKMLKKYGISISSRAISKKIGDIMPLRTRSERRINAIKRGRVKRTIKCSECGHKITI